MAEGKRTLDVAYCDAVPDDTRGNLLDIYEPAVDNVPPSGRPALIWSSGSAWMRDDGKRNADHIASIFNPLGYVVVGLSIRSSSQAQFPSQLFDIRAAIRWLRTHASEYFIDPQRIAIMGNSSGGWVAAIAATTSSIHRLDGEADPGGVSSAVQAAVPFFPPVDFLAMDRHTLEQKDRYGLDYLPMHLHDDVKSPESRLIGGAVQEHPELATAPNPISYVDGNEPPLLILHGTADPLLPPGGSTALYEAVRDAGGDATLHIVEGAGHSVDEAMRTPGDLPGGVILGDGPAETRSTNGDGTETTSTSPPPIWSTVADFLASALAR